MASRLPRIADNLRNGNPVQPVTVRAFLAWYGAQRRGPNIVAEIRDDLEKNGLETDPDFESCWIDGEVEFYLAVDEPNAESPILEANNESLGQVSSDSIQPEPDDETGDNANWTNHDATYRVSKLKAANQGVTSVKPDSTLNEVVTILMSHGFSQIPVMTNERDVKGVVSWGSIGTKLCAVSNSGKEFARDFMVDANEIRADKSLFDAIPMIVEGDYVLVRGSDNKISGIITASDLSLQFKEMTEPFLLLHEIENTIRNIAGPKFDIADLKAAAEGAHDSRPIQNIADLTFGEYIRLLQKTENWTKLNLKLDRVVFCAKLDKIRQIRNDVLHFDPDGIGDDDLRLLREFGQFLKEIYRLLDG